MHEQFRFRSFLHYFLRNSFNCYRWADDYDTLEYKHGFIQWLFVFFVLFFANLSLGDSLTRRHSFPIKEHGMNWESQPLQQHEVDSLKSDEAAIARLIGSYKLMLNFYGMRLVDEDMGLLQRSLPPRNYETRYRNLVCELFMVFVSTYSC
jgi:hypothetical protein